MKIVTISDTHIGNKNSADFWKTALETAYQQANSLDKIVIHSGDWFESGATATPKLVNEVIEFLLNLAKKYDVKLYSILGNHDLPVLNNIKKEDASLYLNSPFYFLEQIINSQVGCERVKVINSFSVEHFKSSRKSINLFFHSFLPPKLLTEKLTEIVANKENYNFNSCVNGFVLHTSFNGIHLPSGKVEDSGIDFDILKDFDFVINGHIHNYQTKDNLLVVGVPYQMKFGDTEGSISIIEV